MFGKKDSAAISSGAAPAIAAKITVIPEIFYGGHDPILYSSGTTARADKASVASKKTVPTAPGTSQAQLTQPITRKRGLGKKWWIIGGAVFLVGVGGIVWFYLRPTGSTVTLPPAPEPAVVTPPPPQTEVLPVTTTVDELPVIPPTPASLQPVPLTFPPALFTDSADLDADSLTDSEEEVFGTDSGTWDTDSDGYFDGQEVSNLYNPLGVAPKRLIDSGVVREYSHPTEKYRVYYPNAWEMGRVDPEERQVVFSAVTGDFVEVRIIDKLPEQSFADWFGVQAAGEQFTDLVQSNNPFGEQVWRRKDDLVAYVPGETTVVVLLYHQESSAPLVSFRHIMRMMVDSFRRQGTEEVLPEQTPVPPVTPL